MLVGEVYLTSIVITVRMKAEVDECLMVITAMIMVRLLLELGLGVYSEGFYGSPNGKA